MSLRLILALALATGIAPPVLRAQTSPRIGFFGGATAVRIREAADGRVQTLKSTIPAGELFFSVKLLVLEAGYAQGSLTPETPAPPRDFVEGKVFAGIRLFEVVTLKGGAHARSYVLPSGTRRRVFWEGRGTVETPLAGQIAAAKFELWAAVAGESNISEQLDYARGAEAALMIHIPRSPVWGRLAYRVERAQFDDTTRSENIEGLSLSLGIGLSRL